MKTLDRDPQSFFAIIDSFLKQAELSPEEYSLLTAELRRYLSLKFERKGFIHPEITKFSTDWYREFYRLIGFKDPYKNLKDKSNREALRIASTLNINTFSDALKAAVKGNQLDYGAILVINPDLTKLEEEFRNLNEVRFVIDDSEELKQAINKSKTILFLPDNAGEIIFDIFLLKYLNLGHTKNQIFIGANETPMLNDVTIQELKELGINQYGTLISKGSNCFGLHEEDISLDFKKVIKEVDLIIAKGQAYLEFFTEYNFDKVFNITRIKYPVINQALGSLQLNQNAIISSKRYAHTGKSYHYGTLNPKIVERNKIRSLAERLKNEGKTIVTVNGSFDIIHLGHLRTLKDAKKQGEILIVGLNSDNSIKKYKSPFRPIISQEQRAEFIASFECVDYVFIFDETNPLSFLEEIRPDVHCNGEEYGENCIEAPLVKKYGGKIHIMPAIKGLSTTNLIKKIEEVNRLEKENKKSIWSTCIKETIFNQKGIIFSKPAIVYRETYSGRDIIAKNSQFKKDYTDERGYVPVEWWIMSITPAENNIIKDNEGITRLIINGKEILLNEAIEYCEKELMSNYKSFWPLTKILDIGGEPIKTSFSTEKEIPPIPVHIHSGQIKEGRIIPSGKLEAYFFPPINVPPYTKDFGKVITRLGLKPGVTKETFIDSLKEFGKSDLMYTLCKEYEIHPYDGWTIHPGTVHAPGPWITFEIQIPQDDFNLASWQLGKIIPENEIKLLKESLQLRGIKDEEEFTKQVVNWEISTDPQFKEHYYRPSKVIEQGPWGRVMQIFFDNFYGEAIEVNPKHQYLKKKGDKPFAGIVWSGEGKVNQQDLNSNIENSKEFLVVPKTEVLFENTGSTNLLVYTVFPLVKNFQF